MKVTLLTIILIFVSNHTYGYAISISEDDLPKYVKDNNPLVAAGNSKVDSLNAKTGDLARSFIPKLSLTAGQESFKYVTNEYTTQPYYGAKLDVNLYNGGRDRISGDISKLSLEKGKAEQKINLFNQLEMARKVFWESIYLKELVGQHHDTLMTVRASKKAALKRIKSGVATNSDQFEFDIKEVEIIQDQKKAQLNLEKKLNHLKILIGIEQSQIISLNQNLIHDHNWRKLTAHSELDHDYLLVPAQQDISRENLKRKLANRKWVPTINAYALWLQNNQRNDFDRINQQDRQQTALGIKATWELSSLVSNPKKASAQAMAKANERILHYQKRELENELHMELKELELLDGLVHNAENNIKRAEKFFNLITSEYRRGVKTSGDMLSATEKLAHSKIRRMEIIKDFHFAKSHIMTKLGQ